MTSTYIHQPSPVSMTIVFIHSDIEWGKEKITDLKFEVDNDIILFSFNRWYWTLGLKIEEVENYILKMEKAKAKERGDIHENFLNKQQQDILLFEEEEKKRRIWEEDNYSDLEVWADGRE